MLKSTCADTEREAVDLDDKIDIPFHPADYMEPVMLNNKVMSLGSIIAAKQQENPAGAKICYHEMIPAPTPAQPSYFEIKNVHTRFAWIPALQGELAVNNIASSVAPKTWKSDRCRVIWQVKWMKKGLMPVCPRVVLLADVKVDVDSAFVLAP